MLQFHLHWFTCHPPFFADSRGSSGGRFPGVGPLPPLADPGMEPQQNPPSQKKSRTQFTPRQLFYLEEKFLENQFPSSKEREAISKELDLTQHHIQVIAATAQGKKLIASRLSLRLKDFGLVVKGRGDDVPRSLRSFRLSQQSPLSESVVTCVALIFGDSYCASLTEPCIQAWHDSVRVSTPLLSACSMLWCVSRDLDVHPPCITTTGGAWGRGCQFLFVTSYAYVRGGQQQF